MACPRRNKILFYQIIECKQLFFRQIILRNRHILFPDLTPRQEVSPILGLLLSQRSEIISAAVFPLRPSAFILHGFENSILISAAGSYRIVRTRRIYFDNFLIKPLF